MPVGRAPSPLYPSTLLAMPALLLLPLRCRSIAGGGWEGCFACERITLRRERSERPPLCQHSETAPAGVSVHAERATGRLAASVGPSPGEPSLAVAEGSGVCTARGAMP